MGMIISLRTALERLSFTSLEKGRVYKNAEVIILDKKEGGTGPDCALVKLENGQWSVLGSRHDPNGNYAVTDYGITHFTKSVLAALVKAGAVSKEDMEAHIARQEELNAKRDRRYAKKRMIEACAELGIEPPEVPE